MAAESGGGDGWVAGLFWICVVKMLMGNSGKAAGIRFYIHQEPRSRSETEALVGGLLTISHGPLSVAKAYNIRVNIGRI